MKISTKYARRDNAILHALKLEGAQGLEDKLQHEMVGLSSSSVLDEVNHKVEVSSELTDNSNSDHELSHYNEETNFDEQIARKRKINFTDNLEEVKNFGGVKKISVRLASKTDSQLEVKSLGPLNYIDPTTSSAAIDVNLGANIKTGNITLNFKG